MLSRASQAAPLSLQCTPGVAVMPAHQRCRHACTPALPSCLHTRRCRHACTPALPSCLHTSVAVMPAHQALPSCLHRLTSTIECASQDCARCHLRPLSKRIAQQGRSTEPFLTAYRICPSAHAASSSAIPHSTTSDAQTSCLQSPVRLL